MTTSHAPQITARPKQPAPAKAMEHGDPCTIVLFGATGDLSRKKLIGAICDLAAKRLLDEGCRLLGIDREPMTDDAFREVARQALAQSDEVKGIDEATWKSLAARMYYTDADLTIPQGYERIKGKLEEVEAGIAAEQRNR